MIRLGILETDTLYSDLITDYQSYGKMFQRFFDALGAHFEYQFYDIQNGYFPAQGECDIYLITGSKAGVYDNLPWISELRSWIKTAFSRGERITGICFGHQMLAHSLGGFAGKSDKGWGLGVCQTEITAQPKWLKTDKRTKPISLIYSHQDQVTQLPPQATRLASSDFCENAAFYIKDQILTFQGHPEFDSQYMRRLLPRRKNRIPEETYLAGMQSLNEQTDAHLIGRWMMAFINS